MMVTKENILAIEADALEQVRSEEMSKAAKWYHDNMHWDKPRWKKYDKNWVNNFRWFNFTFYGFVCSAILFRDTFAELFYFWSFWGSTATLLALFGITRAGGQCEGKVYDSWVVPTALLFEFSVAANCAITVEFFAIFGPLLKYLNPRDPKQLWMVVYFTTIHTAPILTCVLNAYLSKVKLRVDDTAWITVVSLQYWVANLKGQLDTGGPVYPGTPMNWDHPLTCILCLVAQGLLAGWLYYRFAKWVNNLQGDA